MPNLVRRLFIYAGTSGLILEPHSSAEHQQAVHVEYKTGKVSKWTKTGTNHPRSKACIESHGIIGSFTVASFSFLVAITQREEVGQVFGKPIYVVTDVALLPLLSQIEADKVIATASGARSSEESSSDSDYSESEDDSHSVAAIDYSGSPEDEEGPFFHKNTSNTSIAEDVAKRKASYGKFASEWFSRRVWGSETTEVQRDSLRESQNHNLNQAPNESEGSRAASSKAALDANNETPARTADKDDVLDQPATIANKSTLTLLPKILRTTKLILSARSFYFAYDFDLTRRLALQEGIVQPPTRASIDPLYFWNRRMGASFHDAGQDSFLTPLIQGFVGQKVFRVERKNQRSDVADTLEAVEATTSHSATATGDAAAADGAYLLTIISRRSVKRSGLRYLRRGIDDEGNCANTVETEQILSPKNWNADSKVRSFVQLRASIPLYFSQSPYSFKPVPILHNSSSANDIAFKRHFQALEKRYGNVQIAVLVDKHATEVGIGEAYENTYHRMIEAGQIGRVNFEWFDFHSECRGMKFENVERLVTKLEKSLNGWGETVINGKIIDRQQQGVIRTNCMDCLDRTNVAQSAFGQYVLQRELEEDGFDIDLQRDESTNWFNALWADNGDAISRQYASTAALKGDFTRTRKRNWRGQMTDLGLTLSRYYSNMVNDYFSQAVIDVLLGNVSKNVFEDFENSMMSADPGVSVESARQAAVENCTKIVIQDSTEELIHGWTMLSPAQANTLRTLPFEETVVLLTDAALYCCKFDWGTEKVASFEKVDLKSILKIRVGTYVTSTFTDRQLDEHLNQGLVVIYNPGKGGVIRVNTRSLQNSITPGAQEHSGVGVDGGTGIMSWFSPRNSSTESSRTLALKVIPDNTAINTKKDGARQRGEKPQVVARQISTDIERAVVGPDGEHTSSSLVEEGDIINAADARRRTGYLEQLGHSIKKMVWA